MKFHLVEISPWWKKKNCLVFLLLFECVYLWSVQSTSKFSSLLEWMASIVQYQHKIYITHQIAAINLLILDPFTFGNSMNLMKFLETVASHASTLRMTFSVFPFYPKFGTLKLAVIIPVRHWMVCILWDFLFFPHRLFSI